MIGGLQGEFGDLDIKYLKQKISKCRSHISGSFRRTPWHCAKWLRNFRSKRLISQPCNILPLAWSDLLAMAVTPSFQLRITHRLKHWIVNFLSFKTTYRMHKLDFRKCSKSGWNYCHQECFMVDFSLLPLLAFMICLWQMDFKALKLCFFIFLSFPLLCHGFQVTLLNLGLLWWSKSYQNTKT